MHIYVNTCHSTPRSQLCLKLLTHSPSTYTIPLIQLSSAIPVAAMNPFSFNRLLNTLFPVDGPYEIVPQFKSPGTQESIDFVAIFLVEVNRHPVFFIEVKPTASFPYDSKRKEADEQMRNRFMELRQNLNIIILNGISAFGTRHFINMIQRPRPFNQSESFAPTLTFLLM